MIVTSVSMSDESWLKKWLKTVLNIFFDTTSHKFSESNPNFTATSTNRIYTTLLDSTVYYNSEHNI